MLVVLFVFLALPILTSASEIKFSFDTARDTEANILSRDNMHATYTLVVTGVKRVTGEPNSLLERSIEIVLISALANEFRLFGHEGGHTFAARENGAWNTELYRSSSYYTGSLSDLEMARVATSGLDWGNTSAEDVLTRNLGNEISAGEVVWFLFNQAISPGYIYIETRSPSECLGECRRSRADPESWYGLLADSNLETMDNLYNDLKIGAAWQTLGFAAHFYHGMKYWVTGKEYTIPSWWVNPQFDMTGAGVMYALGIWYKTDGGVIVRLRPGYGKNRVEGGHMTAFEVELSNIRITEKLKGGIRGGLSEALKSSGFVGASIERSLGDRFSVGIDANYYDGYHRSNPMADGHWKNASVFVRARF